MESLKETCQIFFTLTFVIELQSAQSLQRSESAAVY